MTWPALAWLATLAQTDTTIPVPGATRLEVENFSGGIVVRAWDRPSVRVAAEHMSDERVEVDASGPIVSVRTKSRHRPPEVELVIWVPATLGVSLSGPFCDMSVEGLRGDIRIETVKGTITVRGGEGFVSLQSVEGSIDLEGARGRIRANTVNEGVRAARVTGELLVETINGDVELHEIDGDHVEATTVNGDVSYAGKILDGGRYRFTTHNGDLTVAVPKGANATVAVATFSGDFESEFPVTLKERRGKRFEFVLGSGRARMELETFNGSIRLRGGP